MNWDALVGPLVRYTLVAAFATADGAYLAFQSGLPLLLLAGAGLLLVVLGAGEAGAAPASGFGQAEERHQGGLTEGIDLLPGRARTTRSGGNCCSTASG